MGVGTRNSRMVPCMGSVFQSDNMHTSCCMLLHKDTDLSWSCSGLLTSHSTAVNL